MRALRFWPPPAFCPLPLFILLPVSCITHIPQADVAIAGHRQSLADS